MTDTNRAAGFTLLEVVIVLALTVPMLLVIGSASEATFGSVASTDRSATTSQLQLESLDAIDDALRFGGRETLTTPATAQDVRAGRAANVGDPIALPVGERRYDIAVTALVGDDDLELQIPTRSHRLTFELDAGERRDGADNDGDGLIDEGSLWFWRGPDRLLVARDLEDCTFEFDRRAIHVDLRYVRPGHGDGLQRRSLRHSIYLQNP